MELSAVNKSSVPKPFLKWAGGKTQLWPALSSFFEDVIDIGNVYTYIEPFVGGGSVFFNIINKYGLLFNKVIINDFNTTLMSCYRLLKEDGESIIEGLRILQRIYGTIENMSEKQSFYYAIRDSYNALETDSLKKAILMIFLNKTCFNGLFRVNQKGIFNVPFGKYKHPNVCDKDLFRNIIKLFNDPYREYIFSVGDFESTLKYVNSKSIVYLDPPYRPLNDTSSFTTYCSGGFSELDHKRLKLYCDKVNALKGKFILSNSATEDLFFERLYFGYNIKEVDAKRSINVIGDKRGVVKELIITNF